MRAIFEFLVLQQLGTMLKSRPVLSLEATRLSVVCAAATTSTILVYLARAALKVMLLKKAMMVSVICTAESMASADARNHAKVHDLYSC